MAKKTETRPATGHINPFGLRMQPELRARIEDAANTNGRSLNAEIVARLEATFDDPSQPYSRAYATVAAISESMNFKLLQWNHILLRKHDTERRLIHHQARSTMSEGSKRKAAEIELELESLEEQLLRIQNEIDEAQAKRDKILNENPKEFGPAP